MEPLPFIICVIVLVFIDALSKPARAEVPPPLPLIRPPLDAAQKTGAWAPGGGFDVSAEAPSGRPNSPTNGLFE